MKIELKSIDINLKFSEETIMFMANVYVEGKKVAYAQNDGRGGATYYRVYAKYEGLYKRNLKLVEQAEDYCNALPDVPLSYEFNGEIRTIQLKTSLTYVIDSIIEEIIEEKQSLVSA
jgi:hypothetical protein